MTKIILKAHPGHLTPTGFICEPMTDLGRETNEIFSLGQIKPLVLQFGERISNARPHESFLISVVVIGGRKPRGFDQANHANEFGQRHWMRHERELALA